MEITGISFEYPLLLLFLLLTPVFIIASVYNLRLKRKEALLFSNFESLEHVVGKPFLSSYMLQRTLNIIVFLLLVFAAAGLSIGYTGPVPKADFAIAIDDSASMSAEDIEPSRMDAAKAIALAFIETLPATSKVGVISFAGTPFVEQPLTEDLSKAKDVINNLKVKNEGGTDIGSAIATATNTLSISQNQRVAILITDGSSTVGLSIKKGVEFAKSNQVIVHTIGIGTEKGGSILIQGEDKDTTINENNLMYIAGSTYGNYSRFTNEENIILSYKQIIETSLNNVNIKLSPFLISIVIMLLGLEWLLSFTRFSRIP